MKKLNISLFVTVLCASFQANAGEFGLAGGVSRWSPAFTAGAGSTSAVTPSISTTFGAFYRFHFISIFALEIDGLYIQRKAEIAQSLNGVSQSDVTYQSKVIQIPVILRTQLIPRYVNVGVGGYYESGMSSGVTQSGTTTGNSGFAGANSKHSDYGLVGSLEFRLPIIPGIAFIIDGRYLYGLSQQLLDTSSGSSQKSRYIQALGGLTFWM